VAFRQGGGLAGEQVAAAASCVENGATDAGSDDEPALVQDGQVLADRSGGQRHAVSELRGVADQLPAGRLDSAHAAFVDGLSAAATAGAAVLVLAAALSALFLRRLSTPAGQPARPAEERADAALGLERA